MTSKKVKPFDDTTAGATFAQVVEHSFKDVHDKRTFAIVVRTTKLHLASAASAESVQ